jgi:hypothetical protein
MALLVSSLGAILREGRMEGWWLLMHLFAAGPFVMVLPAWAFAVSARWHTAEADSLKRPSRDPSESNGPSPGWHSSNSSWRRVHATVFAATIALALLSAGSMLVGMVPWPSTSGLETLTMIHRVSGLAFFVFLTVHACLGLCLPPLEEAS